jgi:hypothetical protein
MQKGVDAVAIGVIALGVVLLIALFVVSNNMMPEPLPTVQMPDLASVRAKIENPLTALAAPAGGGAGASPLGGFGGGPMGVAPPAAPPPAQESGEEAGGGRRPLRMGGRGGEEGL